MTTTNSSLKGMAITLVLVIGAAAAFALMGNMSTAGEDKLPSKPIIENAALAKAHGTLIRASQVTGLVERLEGVGRVTLFAPTDEAFEKLPAGTVPALLKRQNLKTLERLLAYHVVPGVIDKTALRSLISAQGGEAALTTVDGGTITVTLDEQGRLLLRDEQGNAALVNSGDTYQTKGVVHSLDGVLMPAVTGKAQSS